MIEPAEFPGGGLQGLADIREYPGGREGNFQGWDRSDPALVTRRGSKARLTADSSGRLCQGGGTSYNWWKTQKSCDLFQVARRMTTLYADERSVPHPNGRRNIILTIPAANRHVTHVNVLETGGIRRMAVIHNEWYAYEVTPKRERKSERTYPDTHPSAGENRYCVRLEQVDGNLAWIAPVWGQRG